MCSHGRACMSGAPAAVDAPDAAAGPLDGRTEPWGGAEKERERRTLTLTRAYAHRRQPSILFLLPNCWFRRAPVVSLLSSPLAPARARPAMSGDESTLSSSLLPPRSSLFLSAGAIAGLSVDLVLFPMDTIKTRMQSRGGLTNAGGFRKLFSGIASAAAGSGQNREEARQTRRKSVQMCVRARVCES